MVALEWLYAALGAIGGSAFTAFFLQRIAGNLIDRKFREADKNKEQARKDKLERLALDEEERVAHNEYMEELHRGIAKMKDEGLSFFNGNEVEKYEHYQEVQARICNLNYRQLAEMRNRK